VLFIPAARPERRRELTMPKIEDLKFQRYPGEDEPSARMDVGKAPSLLSVVDHIDKVGLGIPERYEVQVWLLTMAEADAVIAAIEEILERG